MRRPFLSRARATFEIGGLLAAFLVVATCGRPKPGNVDEAARLMAQMKAASGGEALDALAGFHETGTTVRDGVAGTYEVWGDLHALRSTGGHSLAGRTATSGFDGRQAWAVGPDGAVHVDTSPSGLSSARLSTYLTISGFFYPDRFPARFESRGRREADGAAYDVVTVTPAGSLPVDLWLDVKTHRLHRISGMDGTMAFAAEVKRSKVIDGIWVPLELSAREGDHALSQEVKSVIWGTVPPERFAPPAGGNLTAPTP